MYKYLLTLVGCLAIGVLTAQQPNESSDKVKSLADEIVKLTENQKTALMKDLQSIKQKLDSKQINEEQAQRAIQEINATYASKLQEALLHKLDDLNGAIEEMTEIEIADLEEMAEMAEIPEAPEAPEAPEFPEAPEAPEPPDAEGKGFNFDFDFDDDDDDDDSDDNDKARNIKNWKKKGRKNRGEDRTTSQFVFAVGLNNLVSNNDLSTFDNADIKLANSRFYEWGLSWKTRLIKTSPFLQFKYGVSVNYNNLRPTNNRYFVAQDVSTNGSSITTLENYSTQLVKNPYFRMIHWAVPMHLEFDFSKTKNKDGNIVVKSQKGLRVGAGGYVGLMSRTKQILESTNEQGQKFDQVIRGGYNTNDFVYGVSGYIGYKEMSLYAKYNLNPTFTSNPIDQQNVSVGLRFDFQ